MTKSFIGFLKITSSITLVLFMISLTYLLFNQEMELDPDSMLMTMLLVVFTLLVGIVQGILLYFLTNKAKRE